MFDGDFVDEEEAGLEDVGDALDFGGDEESMLLPLDSSRPGYYKVAARSSSRGMK